MHNMKILNSIRGTIAISAIITTFSVSAAFAEDVTLTFVGPQALSSMEPVIAAFEAANPTVKVNYESIPFKVYFQKSM